MKALRTLGATMAITAALAASALPARAAVSATTSYQGDAAHSGGVLDPALGGPLHVLWSSRLTKGMSAPLVAGGRVFVLSPASGGMSDVVALDAATGEELWRRAVQSPEGLTYGEGAVYALNRWGSLVALDAATGATRWARDTPTFEVSDAATAPTYFAGTIFYTGMDVASRGEVVAISALDGAPLWESAPMPTGAYDAAVAVDTEGVFVSTECGFASSWTLAGVKRWATVPGCDGFSTNLGRQTVVVDTRAFTDFNSGAVLDTTTGLTVDEFPRPPFGPVPAFGPSHVAVLTEGQLTIANRATLTTVGRYAATVPGAGELRAQPFFVNERVFTVDSDHHLIGIDAPTATVSADVDLNSQLPGVPDGQPNGADGGGIGVGGGVIAVATTDGRVVAVTGPDGPTPAPLDAPTESEPAAARPQSGAERSETAPVAASATPVAEAAPAAPVAPTSVRQPPPVVTSATATAAARRVTFPCGAKLKALGERGLAVDVAGARSGATVRATLAVGGKVVWRTTTRVPKSGRLRLKAASRPTRATAARLELRVSATHATPLVLRRILR